MTILALCTWQKYFTMQEIGHEHVVSPSLWTGYVRFSYVIRFTVRVRHCHSVFSSTGRTSASQTSRNIMKGYNVRCHSFDALIYTETWNTGRNAERFKSVGCYLVTYSNIPEDTNLTTSLWGPTVSQGSHLLNIHHSLFQREKTV